ncbi:hypothetical protein M758_UG305700 [Ceratodon purpureus]|nr:hypothetical protein M758_UG305700 [Ceratodon purpureus]
MWVQSPETESPVQGYDSPSTSGRTGYSQEDRRINGHAEAEAERHAESMPEMTLKRKRVPIEACAGSNSAPGRDADSNDDEEEEDQYEDREYYFEERQSGRGGSYHELSGGSDQEHLGGSYREQSRVILYREQCRGGFYYDQSGGLLCRQQSGGATYRELSECSDHEPSSDFYHGGGPEILQWQYKSAHKKNAASLTRSREKGPGTQLVLEDGVEFQIPQYYDEFASSLHLPLFSSLQIEEKVVYGRLKATAFFAIMDADPWTALWRKKYHMGESWGTGFDKESKQSLLEKRRFGLQVIDSSVVINLPLGVYPEEGIGVGSEAGSLDESPITIRQISTESGQTRRCEVKILDHGDGYELVERRKQKIEPARRDPVEVELEDGEKVGKYWVNLVRKDLPKYQKYFANFYKKQIQDCKRVAELCQREVKNRNVRSLKVMKAAPVRTRRLSRDMIIFWKKWDKEQVEVRKKEEKEAAEALKRDQELREARRQQQRLNFLLTQTELYSHFMQSKMTGMPAHASQDVPNDLDMFASNPTVEKCRPDTVCLEDTEEEASLKAEALRAAVTAAAQQRNRTSDFDNESQRLRLSADRGEVGDGADDMDLLHPSTMPTTSSVQQPKMFQGVLKEYQLKGLQWLVNCYEQGLNGILADEMGLGKTIQAMAFLGHLAEDKNIWGPFLVVAPASVLNNWADEVNRFCPDLRILPYWGALNERIVLRKNINPNRLYRREAGFHVLITSYQLLVSDEKYFRRVKWQYMVLDEAQAIKSASSIRWKTLLSFNCRNRLLLTGTPIQNSMAELWALLHFIMPTLFDSHEQFNEWFSKGIEGHAEHGGILNEFQLTRLHSILKPFMLRRVKRDVITEMTNKKEVMVPCYLSSRQQAFYRAIKNKISVADLFGNGGQINDKKVLNLMNIVIQLRKVCNHPELFERNEGQSSVHFATVAYSLPPPPFGELEDVHYAGAFNPVSYRIPKLLFRDGMRCLHTESSGSAQGFYEKWVKSGLSVFSPENVHSSSLGLRNRSRADERSSCSGGFGFIRMLDLSAAETSFVAWASVLGRCLFALVRSEEPPFVECYGDLSKPITVEQSKSDIHSNGSTGGQHLNSYLELLDDEDSWDARSSCVRRMLMLPSSVNSKALRTRHSSGSVWQPFESLVVSHQDRLLGTIGLLRSVRKYMPAARAPQISVMCSDRGFVSQRIEELENPLVKQFLVGFARTSESNGPAMPGTLSSHTEKSHVCTRLLQPLLGITFRIFGSAPPLQSFDFAKMLTDSGKLQVLDILLKRLRLGNHRVLLFAQMTKMLNILEDYMNYRKFKYLRLDGSSTIMDRRDMVKDFQHRSDIFVFLLSTRAGGLGINLTAADTVIFYESDWNPTMDLQAMDRAHRLGQTKEVTVYRLICKGTVEEKIMQRANQKNTVQQLVMTGNTATQGDVLEAEEVVSLLLDDAEMEAKIKEQVSKQADKHGRRKRGWAVTGSLKGVRLDAEGGGASLDDEKIILLENSETPGASTVYEREINVPATLSNSKRKQNREEKPVKPPKMPKSAKELKPPRPRKEAKPKERKVPKPKLAKQPRERIPRASRDLQSITQRHQSKKRSLSLSESNTPSPLGDDYGDGCGGSSYLQNGYSLDGGEIF